MKTIPQHRVVPAPTGIGWVTVERWDGDRYRPVSTFRSGDEAAKFIKETEDREGDQQ